MLGGRHKVAFRLLVLLTKSLGLDIVAEEGCTIMLLVVESQLSIVQVLCCSWPLELLQQNFGPFAAYLLLWL